MNKIKYLFGGYIAGTSMGTMYCMNRFLTNTILNDDNRTKFVNDCNKNGLDGEMFNTFNTRYRDLVNDVGSEKEARLLLSLGFAVMGPIYGPHIIYTAAKHGFPY